MKKVLKDYVWILIGSIITAAAINIFLVPYKIAPGGVSGIATVIYYLSHQKFPVGITMLVLNVPLFLTGMRFIGKKFIAKTLFGTIILSLTIDATEPFSKFFIDPVSYTHLDVYKRQVLHFGI